MKSNATLFSHCLPRGLKSVSSCKKYFNVFNVTEKIEMYLTVGITVAILLVITSPVVAFFGVISYGYFIHKIVEDKERRNQEKILIMIAWTAIVGITAAVATIIPGYVMGTVFIYTIARHTTAA